MIATITTLLETLAENLREFPATKILARYQTLGDQKLTQNHGDIAKVSKFQTGNYWTKAQKHGINLFYIIKKNWSAELPPSKNLWPKSQVSSGTKAIPPSRYTITCKKGNFSKDVLRSSWFGNSWNISDDSMVATKTAN